MNSAYCVVFGYQWRDESDVQKRCCGDDAEDINYINISANIQCTNSGWVELGSECINSSGDSLSGTSFKADLLTNSYATNGSDGCCGDDGMVECVEGTTVVKAPPCNYDTQTECQANLWCKWDPSNFCGGKTRPEFCAQFSETDCQSGVCQFKVRDYGYVTPDGTYLCYNQKYDLKNPTTEDQWEWLNAQNFSDAFEIKPIVKSDKSVDYISNSDKWYYCNANDVSSTFTGTPINEYSTFPRPPVGKASLLTCQQAVDTILNTGGPYICDDDTVTRIDMLNPYNIDNCLCTTADLGGEQHNFCWFNPSYYLCLNSDGGTSGISIDKEFCKNNPDCYNVLRYDKLDSCNNSDSNNGIKCTVDDVCAPNGLILPTSDTDYCCIGSADSKCVPKANITDEQSCANQFGTSFNPQEQTGATCLPAQQLINISDTLSCCLGVFYYPQLDPSNENIANDSYICYDFNGNNYIGQCCIGDCKNLIEPNTAYLSSGLKRVDASYSRAFASGVPLQSVASLDTYSTSRGIIVDWLNQIPFNTITNHSLSYVSIKNISLKQYSEIAFDLRYNSKELTGKVYINGHDYGLVRDYANNGENANLFHRIFIPIRPEHRSENLNSIRIEVFGNTYSVIELTYDSVYLIPDESVSNPVSNNYYCTGGFFNWIPDLDPPATLLPTDSFFTDQDAWLSGYGKYAKTCDSQAAFGWTGHYCCGDDTNGTAPGEYFNDSGTSMMKGAGCFGGSIIENNEPVWKIKGFRESGALFFDKTEDLKNYSYADLLYYNDSFIGCQVEQGKYSTQYMIYDGNTPTTNLLVNPNNYVNKQCAVIGEYYCMDQIWRQYVPGLGQGRFTKLNTYFPVPDELSLKTIPANTELIKNGGFGDRVGAGGGK
jgi:hypothetical protein